MTTVYRKTPKGTQEIETRAHRLSPRLRSVLILVDGRRSDDELRTLVPLGFDEALRSLLDDGFIDAIAGTAAPRSPPSPPAGPAPRPAPAPPPPAPAPAPGGADFAIVRRESVKWLNDQLGPMAETLAIKMERARSPAELRPLLEVAERMIGSARGSQAAAAFRSRFIAD
jgi:hypothetical protein